MRRVVLFLNAIAVLCTVLITTGVLLYMATIIIAAGYDIAQQLLDTLTLASSTRQTSFLAINGVLLQNVAVVILLLQLYRVLVSFMKFRRFDVRVLMELGIVGSILELISTTATTTPTLQMVLGAVTVFFVSIYAFKYDTFVRATRDAQAEMTAQKIDETKTEIADEEESIEKPVRSKKVVKPVKVVKAIKVAKLTRSTKAEKPPTARVVPTKPKASVRLKK